MDYQTFVTQLGTRVPGAFTGLKNNLVAAGVPLTGITVEEVTTEGVNDLRYRITAKRGNRTLTGYVELTASGTIQVENPNSPGNFTTVMAITLTLFVDGNGNQIGTSYTAPTRVPYTDAAGIEALLTKLSQIEDMTTGELLTAARAFLQV